MSGFTCRRRRDHASGFTGSELEYSNDSARVQLHYTQNNQAIAEEMSCVAEYIRITIAGMFGGTENIYWCISYLTSFWASREGLEGYADLYRTIFASVKINPAWTALVQQNLGQNVELPSRYTQASSTPLGEYILSDDPNFNPNIGSTQTWTPLVPPQE